MNVNVWGFVTLVLLAISGIVMLLFLHWVVQNAA